MFVGRKLELGVLNNLYQSNKFEFLVLYGRRRVGKTALLKKFSEDKDVLFFSAQEKNDALNLGDFSEMLQRHFGESFFGVFENWEKAFRYWGEKSAVRKTVLIIDEFPFLAQENPAIKSTLQHLIDHQFKKENLLIILCGSSISFMEEDVLGYRSPLYGRVTAQLEIKPFDYLESALFFPNYSYEDKLLAYGILGGIPRYLEDFSDKKSLTKNLAEHILNTGSFLKEEPQILLKMELRQPAVYNSILEAIATGSTKLNEIASKIHDDSNKCAKYLGVLRNLRLVTKKVPAGEKDFSRKSIYRIADNYFAFWYRFIFARQNYYEILGAQGAAETIMQPGNIHDYMGLVFEGICQEFLLRAAKKRKLPFVPLILGKWWGNNSRTRQETDIDILGWDVFRKKALFAECKFRNVPFGKEELLALEARAELFAEIAEKHFYVFAKGGFTPGVQEAAAARGNIHLVGLQDLFAEEHECL